MLDIRNINTNTYRLPVLATSDYITLSSDDIIDDNAWWNINIYNSSVQDVCIVAGTSIPTAVFPASKTVPVSCCIVPAGGQSTYALTKDYKYIAMIGKAEDTLGEVFFSFGKGA
jgi:hypothetical protein